MTCEADGRDYEGDQSEGVATHSSYGNPAHACVLTCSYAYSAFTISRGSVALARIGIVAAGVFAALTAVPGSSFAQADSPTGLGYIAPMAHLRMMASARRSSAVAPSASPCRPMIKALR